ncbi:MAG: hypothetical protein GY851_14825 [bacterium]|nr:hypothetical protein [bacterium]
MAPCIVMRISALKAAQSIDDLSPLPPQKCHALKGNWKGLYAMTLVEPFRLVFELIDEPRTVGAEPHASVELMGVRILSYRGLSWKD